MAHHQRIARAMTLDGLLQQGMHGQTQQRFRGIAAGISLCEAHGFLPSSFTDVYMLRQSSTCSKAWAA